MRRFAVLILLAGLFIVGAPGVASAACEGDPPTPAHPYGLLGAVMVNAPDWKTVPDQTPDPFADTHRARLVDTYGYGYQWGTYDLGCGADIARDPMAVMDTQVANLGWVIPSTAGVLVSSLQSLATMGPFDFLDPLVTSIQGQVKTRLWTTWFPIALICAGVFVLWRARRADYSTTARTLGWVGLILAVSAVFLQQPAKVDHLMSSGMTKVIGTASSPFGTDTVDEQLSRDVLYPQWLQGELGTSTGPTATGFGPRLFAATHYSWSDEKQMLVDPAARERINRAKGKAFEAAASELKDKDPAAYTYLTGKQGESRLTAVLFATVTTAGLALFVILGFIVLALAQLIARVFIIGFPLAGIIAVAHPRGQFAVMQLWGLFTAAVVAAVKFAVLTALYTLFAAGVMKAPIGGIARIGGLLLLTILALMVAKPFRSFKSIVPGLDATHSYTKGGLKLLAGVVAGKAVVEHGVETGVERAEAKASGKSDSARAESESITPLTPTVSTSTGSASAATSGPIVVAPPRALPTGSRNTTVERIPTTAAPQGDDQPVYRRATAQPAASGDVDMPPDFAPKQVDPKTGQEVYVIYHRPHTG